MCSPTPAAKARQPTTLPTSCPSTKKEARSRRMAAAVEEVRAAEAAAMQGRKAGRCCLETPLSATMFTELHEAVPACAGQRTRAPDRRRCGGHAGGLGRETVQGRDRLICIDCCNAVIHARCRGNACIEPRADACIRSCRPGMSRHRKRYCIHSAGKSLDFTEIFLFFVACPLAKSMDFW